MKRETLSTRKISLLYVTSISSIIGTKQFLESFLLIISKIVHKILLQFFIFICHSRSVLFRICTFNIQKVISSLSFLPKKKERIFVIIDFIARYTKSKRHRGHWNHPACGVKKTSGKKVCPPPRFHSTGAAASSWSKIQFPCISTPLKHELK